MPTTDDLTNELQETLTRLRARQQRRLGRQRPEPHLVLVRDEHDPGAAACACCDCIAARAGV